MLHDVVDVEHLGGCLVKVVFDDGACGTVDVSHYANKGGVFAPLVDPEFVAHVSVNRELGVLCWPGDIDIAPETLYAVATGTSLPAWAEPVP